MASGKEDVGTTWAQARLAFAKQLLEQINLGNMSPAARLEHISFPSPLPARYCLVGRTSQEDNVWSYLEE